jgi:alpha-methylacyl-CoA racemase
VLGVDVAAEEQDDERQWPRMRELFAARFAELDQAEWAALFVDVEACVTPVLTPTEALVHPHLVARRTFTSVAGIDQPRPAPRFSRTPAAEPRARAGVPVKVAEVLRAWSAY